jgi:hypothetical protein
MLQGGAARLFSFLDHGLHHGVYPVAVSADVQPPGLSQMGNEFLLRAQTCGNEQCFTGKFYAVFGDASGDVGVALNFRNGIAAQKFNGKFFQAALVSCHAAALVFLLHQGDGEAKLC